MKIKLTSHPLLSLPSPTPLQVINGCHCQGEDVALWGFPVTEMFSRRLLEALIHSSPRLPVTESPLKKPAVPPEWYTLPEQSYITNQGVPPWLITHPKPQVPICFRSCEIWILGYPNEVQSLLIPLRVVFPICSRFSKTLRSDCINCVSPLLKAN